MIALDDRYLETFDICFDWIIQVWGANYYSCIPEAAAKVKIGCPG